MPTDKSSEYGFALDWPCPFYDNERPTVKAD